jgi:hypothetical protein
MNFDGLVLYYTGLIMFWVKKTHVCFIKLYFGHFFRPSSGGIYLIEVNIKFLNLK